MTFDPCGLEATHKKVRDAVFAGTPGFAWSDDIAGVKVSYIRDGFPGGFYHSSVNSPYAGANDLMEALILDVARSEGDASKETFDKSQIQWMITDRRRYPRSRVKKHNEANDLEKLLNDRSELFA